MAEKTKISWAHHTFNPWIGCSKVHTGCQNCYAEAMAGRLGVTWGPRGTRRRTSHQAWKEVEAWNRKAEAGVCYECGGRGHLGEMDDAKRGYCACDVCGGSGKIGKHRRRVFPSLCDPFEDWQGPILDKDGRELWVSDEEPGRYCPMPLAGHRELDALEQQNIADGTYRKATMGDMRRDLFALGDRCPNLDFLLLTKRPENIARMTPCIPEDRGGDVLTQLGSAHRRENVWLLYSASDQGSLDAGLPHLLACRDLVPVLGLSLEPLVGPVDLTLLECQLHPGLCNCKHASIDWVIAGGESGPKARPCNVEWIRSIVEQCRAAGVPCFVKQWGSQPIEPDGNEFVRHVMLKHPKGGDPDEWPEDLRVQEYPR